MRWRIIPIVGPLLAVGALAAAVVYAQLGDSQTATGTLNVTTTSANLYICEPNNMAGPDCGSDDSLADEAVFETLEDMAPGDLAQWDLCLKNVGTRDWWVTGVTLNIVETVDPGPAPTGDCPDKALRGERFDDKFGGFTVLGKLVTTATGDPIYNEFNDNVSEGGAPPGVPAFIRDSLFPSDKPKMHIRVASGDHEDVRLRLQLDGGGTENCDANQWEASWQFTVN